jgi:exodeoxyribonuclease-3
MTYNIQRGGRERQQEIATIIGECAPDVVLLQEATDPDVVHAIAERAGMKASGSFPRQSLGYLSREPLRDVSWHRPRVSQHAYIELIPAKGDVRVFGVHLSAVHAAWTEQRRRLELRALLKSVRRHGEGFFHVLAGDFNTIAPGDAFDRDRLPWRLRSLVWLSGGRIRWRTIQTVLEAGYTDAYRARHPETPGFTLPAWQPNIRLDYVFVPDAYADRVARCEVVASPIAATASDHLPVVADLVM